MTSVPQPRSESAPLLEVTDLRTWYPTSHGIAYAVDGVTLTVQAGESIGLVGESGSGKSQTARSILGLVPAPGRIMPGSSVRYRGQELTTLSEPQLRAIRGPGIAMIYQNPRASLNPVHTVGHQIAETIVAHEHGSWAEAAARAVELLDAAQVPDPHRRSVQYPHELSGGLCQRAAIALALACRPRLLIADEPTTALDVTIQAQLVDLLGRLRRELNMAMIFITHDLALVRRVAERTLVMYAGRIVESGPTHELVSSPQHPYAQALLATAALSRGASGRLPVIPGEVPDATKFPSGCRFAPRCPRVFAPCSAYPSTVVIGQGHSVACWLFPSAESPSPTASGPEHD